MVAPMAKKTAKTDSRTDKADGRAERYKGFSPDDLTALSEQLGQIAGQLLETVTAMQESNDTGSLPFDRRKEVFDRANYLADFAESMEAERAKKKVKLKRLGG